MTESETAILENRASVGGRVLGGGSFQDVLVRARLLCPSVQAPAEVHAVSYPADNPLICYLQVRERVRGFESCRHALFREKVKRSSFVFIH